MAAPWKNMTFSVCRQLMSKHLVNGRHSIQSIASSSVHSQGDGADKLNRTPMVSTTPDDSTIVCWHPEPTFPYECTKPLPRKDTDLEMGDSVLKTEHQRDFVERFRHDGPTRQELAAMFYTSKHQWFPNKKKRFIKPYPPRDRPGL